VNDVTGGEGGGGIEGGGDGGGYALNAMLMPRIGSTGAAERGKKGSISPLTQPH
jgi:hypothetical protein